MLKHFLNNQLFYVPSLLVLLIPTNSLGLNEYIVFININI